MTINLKDRRRQLLAAAQQVGETALAEGREFTADEAKTINDAVAEVKAPDGENDQHQEQHRDPRGDAHLEFQARIAFRGHADPPYTS